MHPVSQLRRATSAPRAALALALALCLATPAFANLALAQKKNCLSCHMVDQKVVGPAWRDVATRYAGQDDAVATLASKVRAGGSGNWGTAAMPANPLTDDEARQLVTWILALKKK